MNASGRKPRVSLVIPNEFILNRIYYFRGEKVLLDRDLAGLYKVETKNLNKAVRRNLSRFPADFMFQLNAEEHQNLMIQNGTSSWGGTRKLPYVFTEQGVAMLSGILNSPRAVAVNIQIMRVFTKFRKMFFDNTELRLAIEEIRRKTENNTKNIEIVFRYFDEMMDEKEKDKRRAKRNVISVKTKRKIGYKMPSVRTKTSGRKRTTSKS